MPTLKENLTNIVKRLQYIQNAANYAAMETGHDAVIDAYRAIEADVIKCRKAIDSISDLVG